MFVDFLLLIEVTLVIAAVLLGYVGVVAFFAMRKNDAAGVKGALHGAAVPIGSLGGIVTLLALWGEFAWPLPGSYNILFLDIVLLFGVTLLILAVSLAASLKLQYAGLFALVAGGMTIAYGYTGWQLGLTKDPFEMFLLYAGFGAAGLFAFPATLMVDHYLAHPESSVYRATLPAPSAAASRRSIHIATRAAQPIAPVGSSRSAESDPSGTSFFHLPIYFDVALLAFVAMIALAGIAALFFVDSTLPAHLLKAP